MGKSLSFSVFDSMCLTDHQIMKSRKSEDKKAERLFDVYDDGWEAWPEAVEEEEGDGHDHPHGVPHAHPHPHGKSSKHGQGGPGAGEGKAASKVVVEAVDDHPSPPKRAKIGA